MDLQETFEKYLKLSFNYLAIRNRSEKELKDYLTKKNASRELIEKIIHFLTEKKFLNDESFARAWIRARARLKPKGKALLKIELRQKGIAPEIIETVLHEVQEDIPDEVTQATQVIAKRIERMAGKPQQEIYQKVGAFLARRGFSWSVAKKAIDDSLGNRV
jgi:regulatory protein